ncbi:MAG: B12-binding domain-containing protein, partial [Planctomycetota bacterium]
IAEELPECHTVVGLSNISFGLKPYPRQVMNSVFLHELREAGLTGAIAHASKILPKTKIEDEHWEAALDVIYDRRDKHEDPLTFYINVFPEDAGAEEAAGPTLDDLPVEEALKQHIIDGEKRDLTTRLDKAMNEQGIPPLDIINKILLDGMKVVGDLFGRGEMQLPFVLQSAETMKAAVAHLEPHMEKIEGESSKGKLVLATVKGDVHDIGKNLVDIILTNNGYTVYNIGIKQPINDILAAQEKYKADAIGMSGLLVKSVAVMKDNLAEMNERGFDVPVLLGGAALTRDYAEEDLANLYGGALLYCRDAFDGLKMMDVIGEGRLDETLEEQRERVAKRKDLRDNRVKPKDQAAADVPEVAKDNPVPRPPFWGSRVVEDVPVNRVFGYVNEVPLFAGQWGFKKKRMSAQEYQQLLEDKARPVFDRLKQQALTTDMLRPAVTYGYYPVQSEGDELIVYRPEPFAASTNEQGDGPIKPDGEVKEWLRFELP